ncbi:hypothetical protein GW746_00725 [Candidatus Saccharibacteria bacterium]|nr:hypothetical protein [Candidatus Saccharibacteria bacterium]NCS82928.1 hypothetical protein [Candidatus Saccharibacteria bacterium]
MKKLLTLGITAVAVAGAVGATSVSAFSGTGLQTGVHEGQGNGYNASLESRAEIFGMSADELRAALQTKTMSQIAVEHGLSEDAFRAKMTEAAKARWESRGLSAEEIAERIADREARHAANTADHEFGSGEGDRQGGYGRNR